MPARIVIEDVNADPDDYPHRAIAASIGYRGLQSTPLFDRTTGKPLGMLSTLFRDPYKPSEQELRLTDLYAGQAADVIAFRLAEQCSRDTAEQLRLALEAGQMSTWEWDAANGLVKADAFHQAMFGLPRSKVRCLLKYIGPTCCRTRFVQAPNKLNKRLETEQTFDCSNASFEPMVKCAGCFRAGASRMEIPRA